MLIIDATHPGGSVFMAYEYSNGPAESLAFPEALEPGPVLVLYLT